MPRKRTRDADLFDVLAEHPEGLTYNQIAEILGWSRQNAEVAMTMLRRTLGNLGGEGDSINVTADPSPEGRRFPWVFRLVGSYEGSRDWMLVRGKSIEAQVRTAASVAHSAVIADSSDRRAKMLYRGLSRLLEDLGDLEDVV